MAVQLAFSVLCAHLFFASLTLLPMSVTDWRTSSGAADGEAEAEGTAAAADDSLAPETSPLSASTNITSTVQCSEHKRRRERHKWQPAACGRVCCCCLFRRLTDSAAVGAVRVVAAWWPLPLPAPSSPPPTTAANMGEQQTERHSQVEVRRERRVESGARS